MHHHIEFVIFPGAMGLDITGPLEVFTTATAIVEQRQIANAGYTSHFIAAQQGPVRLSSGLEIIADADFKTYPAADILLLPGGQNIESVISAPEFMEYVRTRATQVKRIVSVCKGTFILAAAGLLNGKQATTHWQLTAELAQRYPHIKVKPDAIFTRDGNFYTSAGVTAGIDLALAIVEEDLGLAIAIEVSRLLVLYFRRPGFQSQFSTLLQAQTAAGKFAQLHTWMIANLHRDISVEQMAEQAFMSIRHFIRTFKAETGQTPAKYLEQLRLDRVREIIIASDDTLSRIADLSGFGSESRLRRAFLRRFGVTPSQYRLHFTQD